MDIEAIEKDKNDRKNDAAGRLKKN